MKYALYALCAFLTASAFAADNHEHKTLAGPKGGKVLEVKDGHAELVIEKDRKVSVYFYDEALKPKPVGQDVVTVVAQAPAGKSTLDFEKGGDGLASKTALPDGEGYQLVIQIKATPDAKPQNFRVKLDLAQCGECKHPEYACTCEGHGH